jgi:hypothetical protein
MWATHADFKHANDTAVPGPGAPAGLAWYHIDSLIRRGHVTSYDVAETPKPAMRNERMLSLDGTMLPGPPGPTVVRQEHVHCVSRSRSQEELIGMECAVVTTQTGNSGAQIQAESAPACRRRLTL